MKKNLVSPAQAKGIGNKSFIIFYFKRSLEYKQLYATAKRVLFQNRTLRIFASCFQLFCLVKKQVGRPVFDAKIENERFLLWICGDVIEPQI